MQREEVDSPGFVLTAFARVTRHDQPLNLYIEDDGLAWRSRNEPSDAPTPHQALGLALAAVDPAANVVLAHLDFPAAHKVKLHSTNTLERLIGAVLMEQNKKWQLQSRYMPQQSLVEPVEALTDKAPLLGM